MLIGSSVCERQWWLSLRKIRRTRSWAQERVYAIRFFLKKSWIRMIFEYEFLGCYNLLTYKHLQVGIMPKKLVKLICPIHMLIVNPIIRTMRKREFMLLSLYGLHKLYHIRVHHLSRFKRIGKKKLVLPLMFLSVIAYLMNCIEMKTSSCLMPYRRLRS